MNTSNIIKLRALNIIVALVVICFLGKSQNLSLKWDSIKLNTAPLISSTLAPYYNLPHRQPLASYGWEDGLQISKDGLSLYALYSPMDILSFTNFIIAHPTYPLCNLIGNMSFKRNYAATYGMDMKSNAFGCDSFANIDIVYSHKNNLTDSFSTWQLSGIARSGIQEGGPCNLLNNLENSNPLFMFTMDGSIWALKNTGLDPANIQNAFRLPTNINPVSNEFNADNPFLEQLNNDSVIMIYEKFTNPSIRSFMYSITKDTGSTWSSPQLITSITNSLGHIEHPCLYKDSLNKWWLYFSIDYNYIVRSKQLIPNNWDSWDVPEVLISKGNAASIGEPTVTKYGDISFSVAYKNQNMSDSTDVYDLDPWILPVKRTFTSVKELKKEIEVKIVPNPFSDALNIQFSNATMLQSIQIINSMGQTVFKEYRFDTQISINIQDWSPGIYTVLVSANNFSIVKKAIKLH